MIPTSRSSLKHGAAILEIAGVSTPPIAYYCPVVTPSRIRSMRQVGVNLITWGWGATVCHCNELGATGPDSYDYESLDASARMILEHHPDAWLFPRVAVTAPKWWLDRYPDHRAIMASGDTEVEYTDWMESTRRNYVVSQASEKWQTDCEAMIEKLVAHIDQSDWGHRCIGLQPTGGMNEWFVSYGKYWPDYSELSLACFRDWLSQKYTCDENLAHAWDKPGITLETATPPSPEDCSRGTWGELFDPAQGCQVPDWWEYYHNLNADRLIQCCQTIKQASGNRLITGAFHGYILDGHTSLLPATAFLWGHHAFTKVRDSEAVDYLAAPYSYRNRQPGGNPESQLLTSSLALAGKISFTENDAGTYRGLAYWDVPYGEQEVFECMHMMTRDQGMRIVRKEGFWWMDLKEDEEWYTDDVLEPHIKRLCEIHQAHYERPPSKYQPQIAVVVDQRSLFSSAVGGSLREQYNLLIHNTFPYIGAPFDILVLDDLADPRLRDYKLYIFLDCVRVTQNERQMLHQTLERAGAIAVWHWLAGVITENACGIEHCSELTGFGLKMLAGSTSSPRHVTGRFSRYSHPATEGISPSHILGGHRMTGHAFINDDDAEALARMSTKGRPCYGIKKIGNWRSVYCGLPGAPTAFYRNLARMAGVHLFSEEDAIIQVCDDIMMVHHASDAPLNIHCLTEDELWTEAFSNETYSAKDAHINLNGTIGTTHLLLSPTMSRRMGNAKLPTVNSQSDSERA